MSFWKRLFGSRGEKTRSPAPGPGRARKSPRVRTQALERIAFVAAVQGRERAIGIHNLSSTGLGLARSALPRWPQRGERLEGSLTCAGERIPLGLRVVRISATTVGCSIEHPSEELRALIERYFSAEIAGLALEAVRPDALNPSPRGEAVWLTGPSHAELYYVRSPEGSIESLELTLFGNPLERDTDAATRAAFCRMIEALETIPASDKPALLRAIRET